jgi:hypothetical protein
MPKPTEPEPDESSVILPKREKTVWQVAGATLPVNQTLSKPYDVCFSWRIRIANKPRRAILWRTDSVQTSIYRSHCVLAFAKKDCGQEQREHMHNRPQFAQRICE